MSFDAAGEDEAQPRRPRKKAPCEAAALFRRPRPLTEEDILDRLEHLQRHLVLPPEVWQIMVELLCPDSVNEAPLPSKPTRTLPGTNARLQVLAERAARGEALFHPGDTLFDGGADPETDRLGILAQVLRNGALARLDAPVVRRGHLGDAVVPQAPPPSAESTAGTPTETPTETPTPTQELTSRNLERKLKALAAVSPQLAQLVREGELSLYQAQILAGIRDRVIQVTVKPQPAAQQLGRAFAGPPLAELAGLLARMLPAGADAAEPPLAERSPAVLPP